MRKRKQRRRKMPITKRAGRAGISALTVIAVLVGDGCARLAAAQIAGESSVAIAE
jgi:hypothetical protein